MGNQQSNELSEVIVFVLQKLRKIILSNYEGKSRYYEFEYYDMQPDEAATFKLAELEPYALSYLHQKGVVALDRGDEMDEWVLHGIDEEKYQIELKRFGLVDNGVDIMLSDDKNLLSGKPKMHKATGNIVYRGITCNVAPSTKLYYVARACFNNFGKPVADIDIIEALESRSFDVRERTIRDAVIGLNAKFKKTYGIVGAFSYNGAHTFIDPSKFEAS